MNIAYVLVQSAIGHEMEVLSDLIKMGGITKENRDKLSKQQIDILEGRELKSHEGMIFGEMYADWKNQKGFNLK